MPRNTCSIAIASCSIKLLQVTYLKCILYQFFHPHILCHPVSSTLSHSFSTEMKPVTLLLLSLTFLVSASARRGGGGGFKSGGISWGRKTSSTGSRTSGTGGSSSRRPSQSQPANYPRQPQNPPPYPGAGAPPCHMHIK